MFGWVKAETGGLRAEIGLDNVDREMSEFDGHAFLPRADIFGAIEQHPCLLAQFFNYFVSRDCSGQSFPGNLLTFTGNSCEAGARTVLTLGRGSSLQ